MRQNDEEASARKIVHACRGAQDLSAARDTPSGPEFRFAFRGLTATCLPSSMKFPSSLSFTFFASALMFAPVRADQASHTLDVYWVDSEGGGSTLIVTPAGESILIDSGYPNNADRIVKAAKEAAGLKKLDYTIVTHFHSDHFGGVPNIAAELPIGQLWDNGIPDTDPDHNPNDAFWRRTSQPYRELKTARHLVNPGDTLPLAQPAGGVQLVMHCLGAKQKFTEAPAGAGKNPLAGKAVQHEADTSDNANSNVWVLSFGPFRFFDGGDLTWNVEGQLVAPTNRAGEVDVYQVNHHGLGVSNNPALVHSLAPTVAVMNNGPTKGTAQATIETLKSSPGIQAIYQLHKNVRKDESRNNTSDELIANSGADSKTCSGNLVKMTVAPDGRSYTIEIPATGHKRTFHTRLDKKVP